MRVKIDKYLVKFKQNRRRRRKNLSILFLLSVAVASGVTWQLRLTGITMTGDLICEQEEHTHSEACEDETCELVCGMDEHTHTDECYEKTEMPIESDDDEEVSLPDTPPELSISNPIVNEPMGATSNDLTKFLKAAHVYDENGKEIDLENESVYVGESYKLQLDFQEVFGGLQFGTGELTYHLPSQIKVPVFTEGILKGEDGEKVGQFTIDEAGNVVVTLNGDIQNASEEFQISIDFGMIIDSVGGSEGGDIDLGGGVTIPVDDHKNPVLAVDKTAGEYQPETHTIDYTVDITAVDGDIKNIVFSDQVSDTAALLPDADGKYYVTVKKPGGTSEKVEVTYSDNGSFGFTWSETLEKGETLTVTYPVRVKDENFNDDNYNFTVENCVTVDGKDAVSDTDVPNVQDDTVTEVLGDLLGKKGSTTIIKDADGDDVKVIQWTVNIGDGYTPLGGMKVKDTITENMSFYTGENIRIQVSDTFFDEIPWPAGTDDAVKTVEFVLPETVPTENGAPYNKCTLIYYTTYEESNSNFENKVEIDYNGKEYESGDLISIVKEKPEIEKTLGTVDLNPDGSVNMDGYISFNIKVDVPAGYGGMKEIYLEDGLRLQGDQYGVELYPEDVTVTVTPVGGTSVTYTPHIPNSGGNVNNTYYLENAENQPGICRYYRNFYVFNSDAEWFDLSTWLPNEASTLSVSYKVPMNAKVGKMTEIKGPLAEENVVGTLGEKLNEGWELSNKAYFYYAGTWVEDTVKYTLPRASIEKTGALQLNDDGSVYRDSEGNAYIDYRVYLNPGVGSTDDTNHHLTFSDIFDSGLVYVPGSLRAERWQDGSVYETFEPDYVEDEEGNRTDTGIDLGEGSLNFEGCDLFRITDSPVSLCEKLRSRDVYYVYYRLMIPGDLIDNAEENNLTFHNTASYTVDGSEPRDSSADVNCPTEKLTKKGHQKADGSRVVVYELELNPGGRTVNGGNDFTVIDTLGENLRLDISSVHIFQKGESGFEELTGDEKPKVDYAHPDITFTLHDETHYKITYEVIIEGNPSKVSNSVKAFGGKWSDDNEIEVSINEGGGSAGGGKGKFSIHKQNPGGDSLSGAVFAIYSENQFQENGTAIPVPPEYAGIVEQEKTFDGKTWYYVLCQTTDENGNLTFESKYIPPSDEAGEMDFLLVECKAPSGYLPVPDQVYRYKFSGGEEIDIPYAGYLELTDEPSGYELPNTGGGRLFVTLGGLAMTGMPCVYWCTLRRKRKIMEK